jgi:hypothetical protein
MEKLLSQYIIYSVNSNELWEKFELREKSKPAPLTSKGAAPGDPRDFAEIKCGTQNRGTDQLSATHRNPGSNYEPGAPG